MVAFLEGIFFVFGDLTLSAACLRLVAPEELPVATTAEALVTNTAQLARPAVGGALYAVGRLLPFIGNALSYFVCACVAGSLAFPPTAASPLLTHPTILCCPLCCVPITTTTFGPVEAAGAF